MKPSNPLPRSLFPFALTAGVVVAVDQLTKAVVLRELALRESISVIDGFFRIVHVRNPGAAFSLFATAPEWFRGPFFLTITLVAVVALIIVTLRLPAQERLLATALGGVMGGAVGNLIDRLAHGEVIDFLYVYWREWYWPAFNVADSSITVSVTVIVLHSFLAPGDSDANSGTSRARST